MTTYNFSGKLVERDDPDFDRLVASVHGVIPRPLCMCRHQGIEMYVASAGEHYIIKRMPDTGNLHAMSCGSYEAPADLSGLGEIIGAAIQTNAVDGTTSLKFDFTLSKSGLAHPGAHASHDPSGQVRSASARLTMRGALHYLWAEAGFNKWSPAMEGKRSWFVIRKYLLQALQDKLVKGRPLASMVYIPETFTLDKKDAIASRRHTLFQHINEITAAKKSLMLLIGEVKEISDARYGKKIIIKHVPDCAFMLRDDIAQRLTKRFAAELELWSATSDVRLIVMGTFSIGNHGVPSMEELTLMPTTAEWIPIEDHHEKSLIDRLTDEKRRFEKGLRYNMPAGKPLACAVLADTDDPVAMYVMPANASDAYVGALDLLRKNSGLTSWSWNAAAEKMPPLPAPQRQSKFSPPAK